MGRESKKLSYALIVVLVLLVGVIFWSHPLDASYGEPVNLTGEVVEHHGPSDYTLYSSGATLLTLTSDNRFSVNGEEAEEYEGQWGYYYSDFSSYPGSADFVIDGESAVNITATAPTGSLRLALLPLDVTPELNLRLALTLAFLAMAALVALIIRDLPTHRPKARLQSQARYFT